MAGQPSLARKVAGFLLLGLGALGLVLPLLQGILFLALGLFILRDQYDWARAAMDKLRARWPRQVEGVEAMEGRLVAWSQRQAERVRRLLP
ncbi:PGPGW domain-containing protein [Paracraurococcus lichenis]|uniref:PGPGW domain-containing protein n=1 Tax=Paracraurococcus lichenis TaxID=3064888 RepID=A0ABT9E1B2_9PROT|nr:PGPGW domain-containing protein [Paracraurococcus sp. LOR1-02]MDO9709902.1 PGPGW domain-containing protein [Paracraurococcus sp. LOR1-02]